MYNIPSDGDDREYNFRFTMYKNTSTSEYEMHYVWGGGVGE